tara:strand:- start:244 stop:480 length:237 start_codon:yes stop_codon:yes gene_type:complete
MKKYYTLLHFDTDLNKWLIVFGDYDLEIVQEEQADIRMGLDVENRRYGNKHISYFQIIATGDKQEDIQEKVNQINKTV